MDERSKLELARECMQVLQSQDVENGPQFFSRLELLFQSLESEGYDISQETENVVQCAKKHREDFNTFAMENDSNVLIPLLMTTGDVMIVDVKIKYTSVAITQMTEPLKITFLSECLQKLEGEGLDEQCQTKIMDTVELVFKSIFAHEDEMEEPSITLEDFLKSHAVIINTALRNISLPEWFCKILSPFAELLLNDDVKIKHLDILLDHVDDSFRENMLLENLQQIKENYPRVKESIPKLLIDGKSRDFEKFGEFLERHQDTLTLILRKHNLPWMCAILCDYPRLLPLDVAVRYYNEIMLNFSKPALWHLLSQCTQIIAHQPCYFSPSFGILDFVSFTGKLFSYLTYTDDIDTIANIRDFAESNKIQLNAILRQNHQTLNNMIFEKFGNIPNLFDFDVNLRFLSIGVQIMSQCSLLELLSDCFQEFEISRYGLSREHMSFAVICLTPYIDNNCNQFYNIAKDHRQVVHTILQNNVFYQNSFTLFALCLQYPNFLDLDIKCLYVNQGLQLSSRDSESLLDETINFLKEVVDEEYKLYNILTAVDYLLKMLDNSISDNNNIKLVQFAKNNQSIINNYFQSNDGRIHLMELLIYEPNLLNFDIKLDYVKVISFAKEPEFFWNFAFECLQKHLEEEEDHQKITQLGQAILTMFSAVDINNKEFQDFFEKHSHLINSILSRSNQLELFILLLPFLSKITRNVKVKSVQNGCGLLYFETKQNLLDDIFLSLANSPSKETVHKLLPAVEVLLSSLEEHDIEVWKDKLTEFAKKNSRTFNEVISKNVETYKTGTVLSATYKFLNSDLKVVYVRVLIKVLDHNQLLDLFSEILSTINIKLPFSLNLRRAVNELSKTITKKPIEQHNEQHSNFAAQHAYTIKHLLNTNFDESLFMLLAPFPQNLDFDMKIKFLKLFLKTNVEKSHCDFLIECVEHYIQHKKKQLLQPIALIISHLTKNTTWHRDNWYSNFAEKYKDALNNILAMSAKTFTPVNAIATFLYHFPQYMNFSNKFNYLSVIRSKMKGGLLVDFVDECLEAIKHRNSGIDIAQLSRLVVSCISDISPGHQLGENALNRLADEYATELKTVVELVGYTKCAAWRVLFTKIGFSSMSFESKVKYLREEIDRLISRGQIIQLEVNRSNILQNSYFQLSSRSLFEWKSRFKIKFVNENGVDGGGLLREWFTILTREIFNPNYALFTTASDDNNSYTINKASHVNPEHLDYFKFVGRFIGKSVMEKQFVDCPFTKSLYKHILNIPVDFKDFEVEDPIYFNSLKSLLAQPISDLGLDLTFTTEIEEFGMVSEKQLKEGGRNIEVTDENKEEYVQLLCQMKMTGSIKQQLDAFLSGFYDLIPKHLLAGFTANELELLICGEPEIDIDDLEAHATYQSYQRKDAHIQWFWQAFRSFEKDDKAKLLMFVTGSSNAPPGGFAANPTRKFVISKGYHGDSDRLPSAHTCAHKLVLPQYESYDRMRQSLLTAIRECSEGFGFS